MLLITPIAGPSRIAAVSLRQLHLSVRCAAKQDQSPLSTGRVRQEPSSTSRGVPTNENAPPMRKIGRQEPASGQWTATARLPSFNPTTPSTSAIPKPQSARSSRPTSPTTVRVTRSPSSSAPSDPPPTTSPFSPNPSLYADILPNWPWRPAQPLPTRLSERIWNLVQRREPEGKDDIIEERVIFARPLSSQPKLIWAAVFLAVVITAYVIALPTGTPEFQKVLEDVKSVKGFYGSMNATLFSLALWILPIAAVGVWIAIPAGVYLLTRSITRLTQVRIRPRDSVLLPNGELQGGYWKVRLRMQTGGHEILLTADTPQREVKMGEMSVRHLQSQEPSSYLNLEIASSRPIYFNRFWNSRYRLNMADSKDLRKVKGEVVISSRRIEHVFGKLVEPDHQVISERIANKSRMVRILNYVVGENKG